MQGYSLTIWQKISKFLLNFLNQIFLKLLSKKCKVIAFLFGNKYPNFLLNSLNQNFLKFLSRSNFGKMQGFSLNFWQKISKFFAEFFESNFSQIIVQVKFWQKCKAIALLFGKKLPAFLEKFFNKNFVHFLSESNFGKNARL